MSSLNTEKSSVHRVIFSDPILKDALNKASIRKANEIEEDSSEPSPVEILVNEAIESLEADQREVISLYYYSGMSAYQISENMCVDAKKVKNILVRASENVRKYILERKEEVGLSAIYNNCDLCSHPSLVKIDEFIHIWIDANGWQFRGILKEINNNYGLRLRSTAELKTHVESHMVIYAGYNDFEASTPRPVRKRIIEKPRRINMDIPEELYNRADVLAVQHSTNRSDIYRNAMTIGLSLMEPMLEINDIMNAHVIRLQKEMRRLF